jgi:hypothetical protein
MRVIFLILSLLLYSLGFCQTKAKSKIARCKTLINFIKSDSVLILEKGKVILHFVNYDKDTLNKILYNKSCLVGLTKEDVLKYLGEAMYDYSNFAYKNGKKDTTNYDFAMFYIIIDPKDNYSKKYDSRIMKRLVFKFKKGVVYDVSYRMPRNKDSRDYKLIKPKWSQ